MDTTPLTDGSITIGGASTQASTVAQTGSQTTQAGATQTAATGTATTVQPTTTAPAVQTDTAAVAPQATQTQPSAATQTPATSTPAATPAAQKNEDSGSLFDKFEIPETVRATYPDLVPLILETESMNDDERQYWFQILPIMTDEQVVKLREILANEKQQLAEIDKQYNKEVKQINEKHVTEWKEFEHKDQRERLKIAETKTEQSEKEKEEQLLAQLNNI